MDTRKRNVAIASLSILACLALAVASGGAASTEKPGRLHCMERFDVETYPVGAWFWGDHRPGGGDYNDADYAKFRVAGFNLFIGGPNDLDLIGKHGIKILFGAYKSNLDRLKVVHAQYGNDPNILGYHLNDNCDLHDYTTECAEWLRQVAPTRLPWMSTNPNPVAQSRVPMPVITSQIYTFTQRPNNAEVQKRIWFCNSCDRDRTHCNRYNMAMWPVIGTYAHHKTPSQYRFQVNTAVAYGAQAVWVFCYNRYFRAVLSRGAAADNHYLTDVAGPFLLGRRSVAVFHSGLDVPPHAEQPGPGKLITKMDEGLLVGVLVPDGQFQAGVDAPDGLMVVDKRTAPFKNSRLGEWTGGHSDAEPRPDWFNEEVDRLYREDVAPRVARIALSERVEAVDVLLPDGSVRTYTSDLQAGIELPPLRGGAGVLLRIKARPVAAKQNQSRLSGHSPTSGGSASTRSWLRRRISGPRRPLTTADGIRFSSTSTVAGSSRATARSRVTAGTACG